MIGLVCVEVLSPFILESQTLNFVNKFIICVFNQLTTPDQPEEATCRCAVVYGILLKKGGTLSFFFLNTLLFTYIEKS